MKLFHRKQKDRELYCPCDGEVQDIGNSCDQVFSQRMLGDGVLLMPSDGNLHAPCEGEVTMCFPTGHAIGIKLNNGVVLLLHLGVDTVKLDGCGFTLKVKSGDRVDSSTLLWQADIEYLHNHAKSEALMIILNEMPDDMRVSKLLGEHKKGEPILSFMKYDTIYK